MSIEARQSQGRYKLPMAVVAAGLCLTACGSSKKPVAPKEYCPLATVIDQGMKSSILSGQASKSFRAPLQSRNIAEVDFGLPIDASTAEVTYDHQVGNAILNLTKHDGPIHVIVGRSSKIAEGSLGVAVFDESCQLPSNGLADSSVA